MQRVNLLHVSPMEAAHFSTTLVQRHQRDSHWQPDGQIVCSRSGGSQDLNYCQSKANPGELSRSRDTKLWDEHLYAKNESDLSASYEAWELLPFFCSPTNDTPLPPTSSDYAHPHQEPQLAPGQEQYSPPELSFARQQEQEAIMPRQQVLLRLVPPHSREGTFPYREPPLPRQFLWPAQVPKLPRGPASPAR